MKCRLHPGGGVSSTVRRDLSRDPQASTPTHTPHSVSPESSEDLLASQSPASCRRVSSAWMYDRHANEPAATTARMTSTNATIAPVLVASPCSASDILASPCNGRVCPLEGDSFEILSCFFTHNLFPGVMIHRPTPPTMGIPGPAYSSPRR